MPDGFWGFCTVEGAVLWVLGASSLCGMLETELPPLFYGLLGNGGGCLVSLGLYTKCNWE